MMKHKLVSLIQGIMKKYPIIDLGQENPNSRSRQISFSLVDRCNGMIALDAGCRSGIQTTALKKKGYEVIPVDIVRLFPDARLVDLNKSLPFDENSFDLIYCSEVLEHLIDPYFTVSEFYRVLKPSGKMIVTTPNSYCLFFRLLLIIGFPPRTIQKKGHIHFFDINCICKLFKSPEIYGFFPFLIKFKITNGISLISPSFIIKAGKTCTRD